MNNNNDQIRETQELAEKLKKSLDDVSKQIENLGKATDYFGKILGDSVKGFNPIIDGLKNATEVVEPFINGIAKANQAYTIFKEGIASGKSTIGALKDVFPGLTSAFGSGATSAKIFQGALADTGIGLIIIAVAALIEKLQSFKPIMDMVNGVVAAAGAVFKTLGEFMFNPIDNFKNLGSSMANAAKDAYKLSKSQDDLKTALSKQEVINESIKNHIDILKQQASNTKLNLQERKKALDEAESVENKNFIKNKNLADQARNNAIEDARINNKLHSDQLTRLKKEGTEYAAVLLQKGDIDQKQFDAIKQADLDLIKLNKDRSDSQRDFLQQQDQLHEEAAKKDNERRAKLKEANDKAKAKNQEANNERIASIARMSEAVLDGYGKEIVATNKHFDELKEKYKGYKTTIVQLEKERISTIDAINRKFQSEGLNKLAEYENQLNESSKSSRQKAVDQLNDDYKKQVAEITKIQNDNEALLKTNISKDVKQQAQKAITEAKEIIGKLATKHSSDVEKLNNSFNKEDADKDFSDKKDAFQKNISDEHESGNWKKEFQARQNLLDLEKKQAIEAAGNQEEAVQSVKNLYKIKQIQLDKEKLAAQADSQKKYLQGVDNMSKQLGSIFGKNTIAAKAAFKAHQAAAAAQVIVDTRTAIMGIWKANAGFPLIGTAKAIAETAIVAATGASNLAQIMKQKPGFAAGGQYVSDGRGTVLSGYSRSDNTNAYLRSGEAVVVSEAMRNPWARNLVSAVNVAFGGRDFSVTNPGRGYDIGGIFTDGGNTNRYYNQPMNDAKDLANTLAYQMINNFPPIYVDVKDINNQQNILAQTVNRVNL